MSVSSTVAAQFAPVILGSAFRPANETKRKETPEYTAARPGNPGGGEGRFTGQFLRINALM